MSQSPKKSLGISFRRHNKGFTSADECAIIEKWKVFRDFCSMMVKSLDKIIKKKV